MIDTEVLKQKLLEKVADLPEERLREVLDFIDFLKAREEGGEDPILKVAGCLSGNSISAEEIEEELYGKEPS
ncbi:MAG TPA: DUF2281 domain-containing protein [Candidatus Atribacteria bacterium]|jgi:hypothetical protein|nr:DUF2281 domain-containing protein [Candidatus Atribacteria bacterium]